MTRFLEEVVFSFFFFLFSEICRFVEFLFTLNSFRKIQKVKGKNPLTERNLMITRLMCVIYVNKVR